MSQSGIYLFCFAGPNVMVNMDRVRIQRFPICSAVVTEVEVEEFSAENTENADWLLPRVTWHEQAVEAVMAQSPVLPAPFASIFSSPEKLARFVEVHQALIAGFLKNTTDKHEWSVRVFADPNRAAEPVMAAVQAQTSFSGSAPATSQPYERKNRADTAGSALEPIITAVADDLGKLASARADRKSIGGDDAKRSELKHWAFLVPDDRVEAFRALADAATREYGPHGLEFRVSGPWPPYSFVPKLPAPSD
jgi:Gas vesicle synthesis protein GvpL/GvpF